MIRSMHNISVNLLYSSAALGSIFPVRPSLIRLKSDGWIVVCRVDDTDEHRW